MTQQWQNHYTRERSVLAYPDENLVRLLRTELNAKPSLADEPAVDLGCGTGRHLKLLAELGFKSIVGLDSSPNAIQHCHIYSFAQLICGDNTSIPLQNETAGSVIAWGSLHYNPENELDVMISEIKRILAPGGNLFATLRSERDTYLKRGLHLGGCTWQTELPDLHGAVVCFYKEADLKYIFRDFSVMQHGLIERTPIGDTGRVISHWVIHAVR